MRIDIVTIFPEFFGVLDVSLLGKARREGVLELGVHDLRTWTHDRHRTVDDTPYGGGAGMVMKPEPWGEALDALLDGDAALTGASDTGDTGDTGDSGTTGDAGDSGETGERPTDALVVFPTPVGVPFTQSLARELAHEQRIVFACGRYEGIDARVADYAATRARVLEVSLGDYVLNGGEVAAMAMIEAIGRLVPGVVGNPDSLVEESHEAGLLEHPSYTKPQRWRGLEVPEVLRGGNHAAIAAWRHEQALERTRRVRPDLLPPLERGEAEGR